MPARFGGWRTVSPECRMRVAIVGFPYSGKTTLFAAVSGVALDHLRPAEETLAAVKLPEPRLDVLETIFKPKKRTAATIDFVDLPGSAEGESEHAGLTRHLPTLRQSDGLLFVLRDFASASVPPHQGSVDPRRDLTQLRDELLLADLEICANRIEKLEKALTKPTKERERHKHELNLLGRCREALEAERPLSQVVQPGEEEKLLRSFGFLTQKPVVVVLNVDEERVAAEPALRDPYAATTIATCATLEADLLQVDAEDRGEFLADYGIAALARDRIVWACFNALEMLCYFTAGDTEVRAWPIAAGSTALDAAAKIHSDLARGFIKAETVAFEDLQAAGSFREAKAAGTLRQEPKGYVVKDGDVITIKFNV